MSATQAVDRTRSLAPAPASRALLRRPGSRAAGLIVAAGVLVLAVALSLALGSRSVPLSATFDALVHYDAGDRDQLVVHELRMPRTLIGLLAGAALGLAGALMQGLTRNPLADPGILGVNAGAALAAALAVTLLGAASLLGYIWFALAGATIAGVVVYGVAALGREGATPVKLALAGAAMTALLSSLTTLLMLSEVETLDALRFWSVGALANRDAELAAQAWPFVVAGALLALVSARLLNALSLGDDVARSLGVRVGRARAIAGAGALLLNALSLGDDVARSLGVRVGRARAIAGAGALLLAATATGIAGPIVFVGLAVPHVARAFCGPDYRWILPWSAVLAPALLLVADVLGRLVVRPGELQVGIVTVALGAPFFVALVRKRRLAAL